MPLKNDAILKKNIVKFTNILNNKNWGNLYINNNAKNSFTAFNDFFMENFENIFPEKSIEIKYKNRHSWMPNSLLKSIKANHVFYKLYNHQTYTN